MATMLTTKGLLVVRWIIVTLIWTLVIELVLTLGRKMNLWPMLKAFVKKPFMLLKPAVK
jgi:hypothetical protein